jgi:NAD(P)H-dependent flavin oxidoreductase YrpB (nitropropane dioxygenase family)
VAELLDRLGVELPIFQAGMGGGLARHELAAAVSGAGGLGTIGILDPESLRREIAEARDRLGEGRPVAVNLLLPFARRAHFEVASRADVVITFWGEPVRGTEKPWIHQCGSVEEALAAQAAGANAVIAQGVEAGGHVRGTTPAVELLERVREALPGGFPVLSAGGIADATDLAARLEAGAEAVVCGTRFLLSEESGAHPQYKSRLVEADETVLTDLFGFGWPAPHRVVPNRATRRWLTADGHAPSWLRAVNRAAAPAVAFGPADSQFRLVDRLAALQRESLPMFTPAGAVANGPPSLVDAGPLYAGESVARISDIRPAADVVRELAGAH